MDIHLFKKSQFVKANMEETWHFFSSPHNLARITPPSMHFKVISKDLEETIYPGMIVTYRVKPLWNAPVKWVTEITHVEPFKRFIDEQRFGPYKFWHHEHVFEPLGGGVLMTDRIHYAVGFSLAGKIAHALVVKKKIKQIFDHRYNVIEDLFNRGEANEKLQT